MQGSLVPRFWFSLRVCSRNWVCGTGGLIVWCPLQGLTLAIKALHELNQQAENNQFPKAHLVVAGGYDKRLAENREHFQEIATLIHELAMTEQVLAVSTSTFLSHVTASACP